MASTPHPPQYPGCFRVATYFTSGSVTKLLASDEQIADVIETMKIMQVEQVFLEVYRDGHVAEESVLAHGRDMMVQAGLRVGGGITTTWAEGFGEPALPRTKGHGNLFCYSSPKTAEDIAGFCATGAKLFDEFMLDDFFSTRCQCPACLTAKGDDPWPVARRRLMTEFSARAVIEPARRANPDCAVIIKYPQWYENFQEVGYDAVAQTALFDAIWVGTETRNPHLDDLFGPVQQSQSWSVYRYLNDIAQDADKETLGGWFDSGGCDEPSYVEQAYQTVLVGTPVLLLFNFDSLQRPKDRPMLDSFIGHLPRLRKWATALGGAKPGGLACYRPPHTVSPGELYVFDYLTMIGIPVTLHAEFPEGARAVFLSGHALADPNVIDKLRDHLAAGRSVVASPQFVLGAGDAAAELFGLKPRAGAAEGPCLATSIERAAGDIDVHGCLDADGCEVLLTWRGDGTEGPFLTRKRHGDAAAVMLDIYTQSLSDGGNMTCWPKVMDLPAEVLDCVRSAALEPLGLGFTAPGRVCLYCFEDGPVAVCNHRNEPAEVDHEAPGNLSCNDQDLAGVTVSELPDDRIRIQLPPRTRVLLTR